MAIGRSGSAWPEPTEACYTKQQIMAMLSVSARTYHKICQLGLLASYRLYPGGPKRHSPQQFRAYIAGRIEHSTRKLLGDSSARARKRRQPPG